VVEVDSDVRVSFDRLASEHIGGVPPLPGSRNRLFPQHRAAADGFEVLQLSVGSYDSGEYDVARYAGSPCQLGIMWQHFLDQLAFSHALRLSQPKSRRGGFRSHNGCW